MGNKQSHKNVLDRDVIGLFYPNYFFASQTHYIQFLLPFWNTDQLAPMQEGFMAEKW